MEHKAATLPTHTTHLEWLQSVTEMNSDLFESVKCAVEGCMKDHVYLWFHDLLFYHRHLLRTIREPKCHISYGNKWTEGESFLTS